jgi:hypothetical protein
LDGWRTIDSYWMGGGQYTVIGWVEDNIQLLDGYGDNRQLLVGMRIIDSYWMGGGQ